MFTSRYDWLLACLDVSNIRNILKYRLLGHSVELLGVGAVVPVVVVESTVKHD